MSHKKFRCFVNQFKTGRKDIYLSVLGTLSCSVDSDKNPCSDSWKEDYKLVLGYGFSLLLVIEIFPCTNKHWNLQKLLVHFK